MTLHFCIKSTIKIVVVVTANHYCSKFLCKFVSLGICIPVISKESRLKWTSLSLELQHQSGDNITFIAVYQCGENSRFIVVYH